ncbi:MFS transporter [Nocardioides sp.]|uniref:MFS transporter n=1 Tax=Nocardioides sp. TaxID=35761 RepID=UPI003568F1D7
MSTDLQARNAVALVFGLNGLGFATLVTRIPDLRARLGLDNGELGLLLLVLAAGSLIGLPASGRLIEATSARTVVRLGGLASAAGLLLAGAGVTLAASVPLTAIGLLVYGLGNGVWDVAMNVEAAEVERRLRRTIMPRFHAGWSLGTIGGAAVGVLVLALELSVLLHLGVVGVLALAGVVRAAHAFLPVAPAAQPQVRRSAWREPRTLALGVMVLSFAVLEGSANDWLALALIDGYGAPHWAGVAGFGLFVTTMTTARLVGPRLLDRHGRRTVLLGTAISAAAGIVLVVLGGHVALVVIGIVLWGCGAALGFPVGMSAAATDPVRAAARVSVVSTIGYGAFLAGPPVLGQLGDRVGTLPSLLAVAALMGLAAVQLAVPPTAYAHRRVGWAVHALRSFLTACAHRRAPRARRPRRGSRTGPG